jgi:phosphopantetheinyl transferase
VAPLLERISYAKRATLATRRADRESSLVGIALALAAAGAIRGRPLPPELLRFPAGGKPAFESPGAPTFSVSHSGRLVVAAACVDGALGVAVEEGTGSRLAPTIRSEWSAREAVVKALGFGLRVAPEVQVEHDRAVLRERTLRLRSVPVGASDCAWLATDFEPADVEARMLDPLAALRRYAA